MILDRFKLDGKNALVTGAGRGIGRGLAFALAEAGANVAVIDILEDNAVKTAKEIAEATGRRTIAVQCDIADAAAVDAMVKKVTDTFGRLRGSPFPSRASLTFPRTNGKNRWISTSTAPGTV